MIFSVILIDITNIHDEKNNYFGFPTNVTSSVRIAEVIALIISGGTEEDTRTALNLLCAGYPNCSFFTKQRIRVSLLNWRSSIFARLSEGILSIFLTFLLVMRSTDVVDLLLNFSAMMFVSVLDDTAFSLSYQGFLGLTCKKMADEVASAYYRRRRRRNSLCLYKRSDTESKKSFFQYRTAISLSIDDLTTTCCMVVRVDTPKLWIICVSDCFRSVRS